jgi:hydrogenase maturation protease
MKSSAADRPGLLVIGYGNTLRGDDGAGPAVAEAVSLLGLEGVRTVSCHQLAPELADPISRAARVVFVDADVSGITEARLTEVGPGSAAAPLMAHAASPQTLLSLARDLYGRCPPAWILAIPAENTELGEKFSERARRGIECAVGQIRDLATPPDACADKRPCAWRPRLP